MSDNGDKAQKWEPQELRYRHEAIMDLMIAQPWLKEVEIAQILQYDKQQVYNVVASPLFKLAFKEYRAKHSDRISALAAEATVAALEFERDVVRGTVLDPDGVEIKINDVQIRQVSARNILGLKHASAVEKTMNLTGTLEDALRLIQEKKKSESNPPSIEVGRPLESL